MMKENNQEISNHILLHTSCLGFRPWSPDDLDLALGLWGMRM